MKVADVLSDKELEDLALFHRALSWQEERASNLVKPVKLLSGTARRILTMSKIKEMMIK